MNHKAQLTLEESVVWVLIAVFLIAVGALIYFFGGEVKDLLSKVGELFG